MTAQSKSQFPLPSLACSALVSEQIREIFVFARTRKPERERSEAHANKVVFYRPLLYSNPVRILSSRILRQYRQIVSESSPLPRTEYGPCEHKDRRCPLLKAYELLGSQTHLNLSSTPVLSGSFRHLLPFTCLSTSPTSYADPRDLQWLPAMAVYSVFASRHSIYRHFRHLDGSALLEAVPT